MVPETLDSHICMVGCYIMITGSLLMFVCVLLTSKAYGNMVPETLDSYICMVSCYIIITGSLLMFVCAYGMVIWFQRH